MDYEALAKQFGGAFAPAPSVDYDALAKQYGGSVAATSGIPGPRRTGPRRTGTAADLIPGYDGPIPEVKVEPTARQRVYSAVRPYVAPLVEAGGAIGGGLIGGTAGTFGAGPVGTVTGGVAGAGLGYGMAKEALEAADVAMGIKPPRTGVELFTQPVRNILEGATLETGGRVAAPIVGKIVSKIVDLRNIPANKAAALARGALGADLDQAVNALRNAPPNASVAEITASIKNPTWQALLRDSLEQSPAGAQYLNKFKDMSQDEGVNALARLVGGTTAAEVRGATDLMKQTLTDITSPARQAALTRANLGQQVADFETQAGKLSAEAAAKVQEVRRLIQLGDVAAAAARLETLKMGMPPSSRFAPARSQAGFSDAWAAKYTYPGKLAQMSDNWASQAAEASLDLGQGAQFAQSAAKSLRAAGIKPLKGDEIITSIRAITNNPEFAGNDLLIGAAKNVADDIAKWSNSGGVVDARALDAIRKNSVNAAIQQMRPGVDATTQRNLAAGVMSKLKPEIVRAIESAGGKGYGAYLDEYTQGMQKIAESKLTGEALRLWKTDKDAFVRLVQNESPETVEKFLGPGKYNIAAELSENTLTTMQNLAEKRLAQLAASEQASEGRKALATLIRENTSRFRFPSWLNFWSTAANKALGDLERSIGSKTIKILAEAAQKPGAAVNLLEQLPAEDRVQVLRILSDPYALGKGTAGAKGAEAIRTGTSVGTMNLLAPESRKENALAP